jgi:hypothetical protein
MVKPSLKRKVVIDCISLPEAEEVTVDDMRKNKKFFKIVWIRKFGRRSEYCPTKSGNNIFLESRSAVLRESGYAILRENKEIC